MAKNVFPSKASVHRPFFLSLTKGFQGEKQKEDFRPIFLCFTYVVGKEQKVAYNFIQIKQKLSFTYEYYSYIEILWISQKKF